MFLSFFLNQEFNKFYEQRKFKVFLVTKKYSAGRRQ